MTTSLQTVSCKEAAAKPRSADVSKEKTVRAESTKKFINKYSFYEFYLLAVAKTRL
jgi:hypothetical protein